MEKPVELKSRGGEGKGQARGRGEGTITGHKTVP